MMGKNKYNKILLVENAKFLPSSIRRRHKNIYYYSGSIKNAKKLPDDFLKIMDVHRSHYEAGIIIDDIYDQYVNSTESKLLNEIMDDDNAHFAIKKIILLLLGKIIYSLMLVDKFIKHYQINESIDFIPDDFSYSLYQTLIKKKNFLPSNVEIPFYCLNKMRRKEIIRNFLYRVTFLFYPLLLIFIMKIGNKKIKKNNYKYAIILWDSVFGIDSLPLFIDLLVGGNQIKNSDVLYVMDQNMSKKNLELVRKGGLNYCYFKEMIKSFSAWQYLTKMYLRFLKIGIRLYMQRTRNKLVTEGYLKTFRWIILWEIFFSQYKVTTFLSVQEPGNIARILIQRRKGSNAAFVFLSTSYECTPREKLNTHSDSYYSHLLYDKFFACKIAIQYIRNNINYVKEYVESGLLWSDVVFKVRKDIRLKAKIINDLRIPKDKIIISFFDTVLGRSGICEEKDGVKAINNIYQLLDTNDDYFMIYKSRSHYKYSIDSLIRKAINRLMSHKRVLHTEELILNYTTRDFMGISNLVIGIFTSSAPIESVVGGVRTVCYVPSEELANKEFVINTFPRFCAYNYDQLKEYVEYWLYKSSEDDFRNFQELYIKKNIDSFCDGQAVKRLHSYLKQLEVD